MENRTLDNYEIREEIGRGGMAAVYLARDTRLRRDVAVKVLHTHIAKKEENRERFEREAQAAARLRHPNIVAVYGCSSHEADTGYLACELVRGPTLREFVESVGFREPEAGAAAVLVLAEALEHAHAAGVIHRDVKPENVLISEDGVPKLADFGLARILDAQKVTVTGALIGSPAHMSPEIIEGMPYDHRADIFALGTVLYFVCTGQLPFDGPNPAAVLTRILAGKYTPPERVTRKISRRIAAVMRRAMATDPAERYASAGEMARDLRAALGEVGLDRPGEELRAFFANPRAWEADFVARLSTVLLDRADEALGQGRVATALACCDRVLASDPGSARAIGLGAAIERRGRHRRYLAIGAAALFAAIAVVGLFRDRPIPPPDGVGERDSADATGEATRGGSGSERLVEVEPEPTADRAASAVREASDRLVRARIEGQSAALAEAIVGLMAIAQDEASRAARASPTRPPWVRPPLAVVDLGAGEADAGTAPPPDASSPEEFRVFFAIWPPSSVLTIDGQRYGTPQSVRDGVMLTAGRHTVVASIPNLEGAREERTFEVGPGRPDEVRFAVPWPPGWILVTSERTASVFVEGVRIGPTNQRIEVPLPGRENVRRLTVRVIPQGEAAELFEAEVEIRTRQVTTLAAPF